MDQIKLFMNSPLGPKTTHFWGPVANWGFVLSGIMDASKPPEKISMNMSVVLFFYSVLFMRFAWQVKPRNYLLLGCHFSNSMAQFYLFQKVMRYRMQKEQVSCPT